MADSYAFSARALTVGYRGKPLIRDIAFQLPKGKILALIGPNGAGKSTILKTITRQLAAIAGTALIENKETGRFSRGELAKKMSVLLTERVRPEMMTCFDVAAMGRYPHTGRFGRLSEKDVDIVQGALRRVRAEEIAGQDFDRISDGQRQRVLLARALCQEPEILVLDEPTSFLDIRYKIDLLSILLEETREKRLTVILSLHEIDLAEKIADYILCVKGDTVWRYGSPEDIFQDEIIAELYDLTQGSYVTSRGSVELQKPEGAPRVFVIGGNGCGLPAYRALQKKRVPFAAGILFENDLEYGAARALAAEIVSVKAFEKIDESAVSRAKDCILRCAAVLDAGAPLGALNQANGELLNYAKERAIRIVRNADELDGCDQRRAGR